MGRRTSTFLPISSEKKNISSDKKKWTRRGTGLLTPQARAAGQALCWGCLCPSAARVCKAAPKLWATISPLPKLLHHDPSQATENSYSCLFAHQSVPIWSQQFLLLMTACILYTHSGISDFFRLETLVPELSLYSCFAQAVWQDLVWNISSRCPSFGANK